MLMCRLTGLDSDHSVMVRVPTSGVGVCGFDPGPHHTKDIKNGTNGFLGSCLMFSIHKESTGFSSHKKITPMMRQPGM